MFYLYKIINNINGKFYIGKTNNTIKRWKQHEFSSRNNPKLLIHKAIKKYGIDNFNFIILNEFNNDKEVCEEEIIQIKLSDKNMIYNIALGGNGGNTMSIDKIKSQYSISEDRYDEFLSLFNEKKTQLEISKIMNVGKNSVIGCAKRLGLSFKERRNIVKDVAKKGSQKQKKSYCKYEKEERSSIWSKNMIDVNKKRGISDELKNEISDRYFNNNETSKHISEFLRIKRSTIRGVINREYKLMDDIVRINIKKTRASIVRKGVRNSNYNKLKIIKTNL
jgi:group I intron endonuclease